jgi:hypothetical protein
MSTSPRRRWFQFSLATMFVVVTAVAIWLGWELKFIRDRKATIARMVADGSGSAIPKPASLYPSWRRRLGDELFGLIIVPDAWTEGDAMAVKSLFPESRILWKSKRLDGDLTRAPYPSAILL